MILNKKFNFILLFLFSWGFYHAEGQNSISFIVKDFQTQEPLPGVNAILQNTDLGGSSNINGLVTINNIPDGKQTIIFSSIGYNSLRRTYQFPLQQSDPLIIFLKPDQHELEQVVVTALRGSRNIEDIPTRLEVITEEELGEKAAMNSTNIAMLLRESTGILVQQTNANSANASIRIQGLDGRYTQILRDGFPIYSGFAGGLSIMQIPPLDLHQVEVIKGSASTLYGGGAIAGLVNLVSKTPEEEPELSVMLNQTSALGTTLSGFYAEEYGKTGFTIYASGNHQSPYDPNNDGFSAIPKIRSISMNPRIFYSFNENTSMNFGINSVFENREGGNMEAIKNGSDPLLGFTEKNISKRISSQFQFEKKFPSGRLNFKNSVNYFNRNITIPSFAFTGEQWATFTEASYAIDRSSSDWIVGGNIYSDSFEDKGESDIPISRDYQHNTFGLFAQNNIKIHEAIHLEAGIRTDFNNQFGAFFLPRVSGLFKFNPNLTARLGGGLGYKIPTIFTEEAERRIFENILPLRPENVSAENSIGGNFDLNYKITFGEEFFFTINQLFFYTRLENSLVLIDLPSNLYQFVNADGPINSSGFETNMKFFLYDFKIFLNYAFINARLDYNNINHQKPLTPKHNAGATFVYENEKWMLGYELYYTGVQYLGNFSPTPDFWIMGFMAMRNFNRFSIFINFENFTDTRQSRYQPMVFPPLQNPSFPEIWAPTDGFVANGGIKINLLH